MSCSRTTTQKIDFIFANCANTDEMTNYAAFDIGLRRCLPKHPLGGWDFKGLMCKFAIVQRSFRDGIIFWTFSKHQALFRSYMDLSCCFILYTCTIYALFLLFPHVSRAMGFDNGSE